MPVWEIVPAILDGDILGDDEGKIVTSTEGYAIGYASGWRIVGETEGGVAS